MPQNEHDYIWIYTNKHTTQLKLCYIFMNYEDLYLYGIVVLWLYVFYRSKGDQFEIKGKCEL